MNARQRTFCECYASCLNAAEAARQAGYSEKTARSQGQRLLTNADIWEYIRELQNRAATGRIASMVQIKAFWSDTMNNPDARLADRLKASEMLAKAAGAFVHLSPYKEEEVLAAGQMDGEDVVIYLPALEREEACEWREEESR